MWSKRISIDVGAEVEIQQVDLHMKSVMGFGEVITPMRLWRSLSMPETTRTRLLACSTGSYPRMQPYRDLLARRMSTTGQAGFPLGGDAALAATGLQRMPSTAWEAATRVPRRFLAAREVAARLP